MASIDEVAEEYVARATALDPFLATCAGIGGHDGELPDLSADGFAGRAGLDRSTLAALEVAQAPALREQIARTAMRERLALAVERYDAGDVTSELNVIEGWVQFVRQLFDLMPTDGEQAAANITQRMAAVPDAYRQLSATLLGAARRAAAGPRPGARSRRSPSSVPPSSGTATSAGPGRPPPTSWARGSGSGPGKKRRSGLVPASASGISIPGRSAWAAWAWTRCVRPWLRSHHTPADQYPVQRDLRHILLK